MDKYPKHHYLAQLKKEFTMRKLMSFLIAVAMVISMTVSPVCAGGGKVQHEHGAADAPGPGDDAMGSQSHN